MLIGSVVATILLHQLVYWWVKQGHHPFYRFAEACEHEKYRPGDSWQEELGFSWEELDSVRKKIAVKIKKGTSKKDALASNPVIYWTDSSRLTWYEVNEELLAQKLVELYTSSESKPRPLAPHLAKPDLLSTYFLPKIAGREQDDEVGERWMLVPH